MHVLCRANISEFLGHYRKSFPNASILPKMHIMEDHVVQWLRRWKIGAGLTGEQGAESIHAHLNRLDTQFNGIVNPIHRLKYIIKEHNIESLPCLNSLQPLPKKKPKSLTFTVNAVTHVTSLRGTS